MHPKRDREFGICEKGTAAMGCCCAGWDRALERVPEVTSCSLPLLDVCHSVPVPTDPPHSTVQHVNKWLGRRWWYLPPYHLKQPPPVAGCGFGSAPCCHGQEPLLAGHADQRFASCFARCHQKPPPLVVSCCAAGALGPPATGKELAQGPWGCSPWGRRVLVNAQIGHFLLLLDITYPHTKTHICLH